MILRCSQFCCKDGGDNYFCVGKYMDFTFLLRWFLESFCWNGGGDNVLWSVGKYMDSTFLFASIPSCLSSMLRGEDI